MQPEIDFLGLPLKTFGLLFGLGFIAAGLVLARRFGELGKPVDWAYELIFAALVGGILGAKLWYVFDAGDLGDLLTGSGLVWYGGVLGGAAGAFIWARRRGVGGLTLIDVCAPGLALGYAVGRLGCQISGDGDYGKGSDLPWAMAYPDGVVPTDEVVHPSPVYEVLGAGLSAWILWRLRDRARPGMLFALYLVLLGSERLLVEFVRRNEPLALGLTIAQFLSLGMIVAGLAWIARSGGMRAFAPTSA